MLDALNEFVTNVDGDRHIDEFNLQENLGTPLSQYYHACYAIARVMLVPEKYREKRKCVIFHGEVDSGKSRIAEYMKIIFDAHYKNETKGQYDEKISRKEAHKHLYIHDEAALE